MKQASEKRERVLNGRYDLSGNGILRVFRHQLLAKCIPMGISRGGAGFKCLLVLGVVHYFGNPIFSFMVRYERQAAYLYKLRERIKKRSN